MIELSEEEALRYNITSAETFNETTAALPIEPPISWVARFLDGVKKACTLDTTINREPVILPKFTPLHEIHQKIKNTVTEKIKENSDQKMHIISTTTGSGKTKALIELLNGGQLIQTKSTSSSYASVFNGHTTLKVAPVFAIQRKDLIQEIKEECGDRVNYLTGRNAENCTKIAEVQLLGERGHSPSTTACKTCIQGMATAYRHARTKEQRELARNTLITYFQNSDQINDQNDLTPLFIKQSYLNSDHTPENITDRIDSKIELVINTEIDIERIESEINAPIDVLINKIPLCPYLVSVYKARNETGKAIVLTHAALNESLLKIPFSDIERPVIIDEMPEFGKKLFFTLNDAAEAIVFLRNQQKINKKEPPSNYEFLIQFFQLIIDKIAESSKTSQQITEFDDQTNDFFTKYAEIVNAQKGKTPTMEWEVVTRDFLTKQLKSIPLKAANMMVTSFFAKSMRFSKEGLIYYTSSEAITTMFNADKSILLTATVPFSLQMLIKNKPELIGVEDVIIAQNLIISRDLKSGFFGKSALKADVNEDINLCEQEKRRAILSNFNPEKICTIDHKASQKIHERLNTKQLITWGSETGTNSASNKDLVIFGSAWGGIEADKECFYAEKTAMIVAGFTESEIEMQCFNETIAKNIPIKESGRYIITKFNFYADRNTRDYCLYNVTARTVQAIGRARAIRSPIPINVHICGGVPLSFLEKYGLYIDNYNPVYDFDQMKSRDTQKERSELKIIEALSTIDFSSETRIDALLKKINTSHTVAQRILNRVDIWIKEITLAKQEQIKNIINNKSLTLLNILKNINHLLKSAIIESIRIIKKQASIPLLNKNMKMDNDNDAFCVLVHTILSLPGIINSA